MINISTMKKAIPNLVTSVLNIANTIKVTRQKPIFANPILFK